MMVGKAILFLITMAIAKHHHKIKDDLDAEENFFDNVYLTIHTIMDNLFESIGITNNFSKAFNTQLLLTMHYDLSNIVDKNLDIFNDIKNLVKVDNKNQTIKVVQLDPTVEEVLNEDNYDAYGAFREISKHMRKLKNGERAMNLTDNSEYADSTEFTEFVASFLTTINNLTLHKYKKPSKPTPVTVPSKKNLKVWEGPTNIELDVFKMTNTRRLFGGIKTQVNKFPFIVSIHIMGEFACAGSIIHRDLVITAASCLQIVYQNEYLKNNLKAIYVRLSSDYTNHDGETIPVQNLYVHPAYNPETLSNNVAIISLEKRHRYSRQQKRIRRILFDKTPGNLTNITQGILTLGWGATKKGQEVPKSPELTMDLLDLLPIGDCARKYSVDLISKDNFCVGVNNSSRGACHGDLGGPGIVGAVLVGIVSFGDSECGATNSLTVFTKLGYYTTWIENILSMHKKSTKSNEHHNDTRRKSNNFGFIHLNMTPAQKQKIQKHAEDYPDEVKVLRNILVDLVKSDNTAVDEVIYGDAYEDFTKVITTVTVPDKIKAIPTKHRIHKYKIKPLTARTAAPVKTTITVTTPISIRTTTPVTSILSQGIDSFLKSIIPTDTFKMILKRPNISDHESENEANANDYTDNYEQSGDEYHGLSIEIPSTRKIQPKTQKIVPTTKKIKTNTSSKVTKKLILRNQAKPMGADQPEPEKGPESELEPEPESELEHETGETLKVDFGRAGLLRIDLDEMASNLKDADNTDSDKIGSDIEMDKKNSNSLETDSNMMESNNVYLDETETSLEVIETTQSPHILGTSIHYDIDQGANRDYVGSKRIIMRNQGTSEKRTQSEQDSGRSLATRPFYFELDTDSSDSKQNKDEPVAESTTKDIRISFGLSEKPKEDGEKSFLTNFILSL
ncbi:uncharacterized protein LOC111350941 [Spodoptera litura]|uniref:Uncharacterized protein LOC111350941 n=1 Tax=Spodoptera litura TaxID=69820 RepID=A0A9J7DUI9_SPOLT|nr:uncharacterized protein LOC111350941 [Spodoptera litura]